MFWRTQLSLTLLSTDCNPTATIAATKSAISIFFTKNNNMDVASTHQSIIYPCAHISMEVGLVIASTKIVETSVRHPCLIPPVATHPECSYYLWKEEHWSHQKSQNLEVSHSNITRSVSTKCSLKQSMSRSRHTNNYHDLFTATLGEPNPLRTRTELI